MDYKGEHSDLLNSAYILRGLVINELSLAEMLMDTYISSYYCSSKDMEDEFHFDVLRGLSIPLSKKKNLFLAVLKKKNSEFHKQHSELLSSDLHNLIENRNILAHQVLDTTPVGLESYNKGELRFIKNYVQPDEAGIKKFDQILFSDLQQKLHRTIKILKELFV